MKQQERLTMALPNGEFKKPILKFMRDVGLNFDNLNERCLKTTVTNMPVDFVLIRASSVPEFVRDPKSESRVGITGSDILWNAGLGRDAGEEIPIYKYYEKMSNPTLFVGITRDFAENIARNNYRSPRVTDLSGYMMATKFENITKEYLAINNVENVTIRYIPGSDEAVPYLIPECTSILGLCSTGKTLAANDIEILDTFYSVTLRLIAENYRLSPGEIAILDEVNEKIAVAMERKRMI